MACGFMDNPLVYPLLRTKGTKPQSEGSTGRYGSGILSPLISLRLGTTLVSDEEANVVWGLPSDKCWIPSRGTVQMEGKEGFDDPPGMVKSLSRRSWPGYTYLMCLTLV